MATQWSRLFNNATTRTLDVPEPSDSLFQAVPTGISITSTILKFTGNGTIGDNATLTEPSVGCGPVRGTIGCERKDY